MGVEFCGRGEAGTNGILVDIVEADVELVRIADAVVSETSLPDGEF